MRAGGTAACRSGKSDGLQNGHAGHGDPFLSVPHSFLSGKVRDREDRERQTGRPEPMRAQKKTCTVVQVIAVMEPLSRIELLTSSLPRMRSTY